MKLYFKTKTDINGNTYALEIDLDNKNIEDNNLPDPDAIVVPKRKLRALEDEFINAGFSRNNKIFL